MFHPRKKATLASPRFAPNVKIAKWKERRPLSSLYKRKSTMEMICKFLKRSVLLHLTLTLLDSIVLPHKMLLCDHSNESYWAVLSCSTVCYAVQDFLSFFCNLSRLWSLHWGQSRSSVNQSTPVPPVSPVSPCIPMSPMSPCVPCDPLFLPVSCFPCVPCDPCVLLCPLWSHVIPCVPCVLLCPLCHPMSPVSPCVPVSPVALCVLLCPFVSPVAPCVLFVPLCSLCPLVSPVSPCVPLCPLVSPVCPCVPLWPYVSLVSPVSPCVPVSPVALCVPCVPCVPLCPPVGNAFGAPKKSLTVNAFFVKSCLE